jgi:hypothetical protein
MNETDYISIHTGGDLEVDVLKPAQSRIFASLSRFSLAVTPSPKSRYSTVKDIRFPLKILPSRHPPASSQGIQSRIFASLSRFSLAVSPKSRYSQGYSPPSPGSPSPSPPAPGQGTAKDIRLPIQILLRRHPQPQVKVQSRIFAFLSRFSLAVTPSPKARYTVKDIRLPLQVRPRRHPQPLVKVQSRIFASLSRFFLAVTRSPQVQVVKDIRLPLQVLPRHHAQPQVKVQSRAFASLSRFSLAVTPSPKSRYSQGYPPPSPGSLSPSPPWMKELKGIIHGGEGAFLRCPVSNSVQFSLRNEGSTENMCVRGEITTHLLNTFLDLLSHLSKGPNS